LLEECLCLGPLQLEGGCHHAVFDSEGLRVQVDGGNLRRISGFQKAERAQRSRGGRKKGEEVAKQTGMGL
jgi:hypothetical protein